jgi:transcriptional regulator with XRE-family HTH domain
MLIHKVFTFLLQVNGKSELFVNFFSDRVKALQEARRMTAAEVLEHLKISPPMFSMIKTGQRNPSVKTLRRLEQAEIDAGIVPQGQRRQPHYRGASAKTPRIICQLPAPSWKSSTRYSAVWQHWNPGTRKNRSPPCPT